LVLKNQLLRQFLKKKHFLQKREMKMEVEHLIFSKGPQRVAPFSHAVRAGEYLFITGQMPTLKNDNTKLVEGGIEEQTRQVMKNLIDVLNAAGSSLEKVIFARVYLVNFHDFNRMNEVYSSFFKSDKLPGRTCIGVTGLAVGSLVEIDFVAAV
jgi:reactive intermediate/imine deaminase